MSFRELVAKENNNVPNLLGRIELTGFKETKEILATNFRKDVYDIFRQCVTYISDLNDIMYEYFYPLSEKGIVYFDGGKHVDIEDQEPIYNLIKDNERIKNGSLRLRSIFWHPGNVEVVLDDLGLKVPEWYVKKYELQLQP